MEINVLNNSFQKIAVIDQFVSLLWSKRYYDIGALDLEIEANVQNISTFKKGYYITRNDDDAIYRIEAMEVDTQEDGNNVLIIGAYDCKQILNQRIVWNQINWNGTVENYIRKLITDNIINPQDASRKINNFGLKSAKGYTELIEQQVTYDDVGEKITELCKTFGYGSKVTFENGSFYFDLYKGVNHSIEQSQNIKLVFSPDYENIVSTKYKTDDSKFKNVALVGGEGEGTDRKKRTIGSASGIDRKEMFIDASGISSNNGEIDLVDYYKLLIAEGKEKLAEQAVTTSFEGEVDTEFYKYKVDYDLGDIITIKNEYGIMANARITEVIETWDEEGYTVEPKFEYFEPIEYEEIVDGALLTENNLMLTTENNAPLLAESSQSSEGIKISELEAVSDLYDGCCFPIVQNGQTKKVTKATLQSEIQEHFIDDSVVSAEKTWSSEKTQTEINKISNWTRLEGIQTDRDLPSNWNELMVIVYNNDYFTDRNICHQFHILRESVEGKTHSFYSGYTYSSSDFGGTRVDVSVTHITTPWLIFNGVAIGRYMTVRYR